MPGYESISMCSPSRHTSIVVAATKQANAIMPTRMFQALARDVYGPNMGFGLTPAQALASSYTGYQPEGRVETRSQQPRSPRSPRFEQTTRATTRRRDRRFALQG